MHKDDDMARNVRSQMQRDAAPAPEEVQRQHEQFLSDEGCQVCGEDNPKNLVAVQQIGHCCSAMQAPKRWGEPIVFCNQHARSSQELFEAREYKRARENDTIAIVWYGCDVTHYVQKADYNDPHPTPIQHREVPEAPIKCLCGAKLKEIDYLDE